MSNFLWILRYLSGDTRKGNARRYLSTFTNFTGFETVMLVHMVGETFVVACKERETTKLFLTAGLT